MSKCIVDWNEEDLSWRCKRFFLSVGKSFPHASERCYHFKCPGRRGYFKNNVEIASLEQLNQIEKPTAPVVEVEEEPVVEQEICAWFRCDQPVAPNKLRHCSEVCRKRQNRWDYKQRQKALKSINS